MDHRETEEEDAEFVEDFSCSGDEGERVIHMNDRKRQLRWESSPPLLLAYSISSGRAPEDSWAGPGVSEEEEEEEEEDSELPIEEWMILGGENQVGDSSIQLNLSYSRGSEECGAEDPHVPTGEDMWAVSVKDKVAAVQSQTSRYFCPDRYLICALCNKEGHLSKNCYYHKKCPTCVLCGIQGHVQRDCPSRPCPSCGLPPHGLRLCETPPLWKQLCQRCGMPGHLSDSCPDTWRQYHMTIRSQVPLIPETFQRLRYKRCFSHCYNCAKRGHLGYECTQSRMASGRFPSLPFVSRYDTVENILKHRTRMHERTKDQQDKSDPTRPPGEENQPGLWRSRSKQEMCGRASSRRKTWPERRRERQEVKKLRREAQARREGGLLGRSHFGDEADPFTSNFHCHHHTSRPTLMKRKDEAAGRRSRKSREAERWRKRGAVKRGDLYPNDDVDIKSENLLSPKQRVRHRKR